MSKKLRLTSVSIPTALILLLSVGIFYLAAAQISGVAYSEIKGSVNLPQKTVTSMAARAAYSFFSNIYGTKAVVTSRRIGDSACFSGKTSAGSEILISVFLKGKALGNCIKTSELIKAAKNILPGITLSLRMHQAITPPAGPGEEEGGAVFKGAPPGGATSNFSAQFKYDPSKATDEERKIVDELSQELAVMNESWALTHKGERGHFNGFSETAGLSMVDVVMGDRAAALEGKKEIAQALMQALEAEYYWAELRKAAENPGSYGLEDDEDAQQGIEDALENAGKDEPTGDENRRNQSTLKSFADNLIKGNAGSDTGLNPDSPLAQYESCKFGIRDLLNFGNGGGLPGFSPLSPQETATVEGLIGGLEQIAQDIENFGKKADGLGAQIRELASQLANATDLNSRIDSAKKKEELIRQLKMAGQSYDYQKKQLNEWRKNHPYPGVPIPYYGGFSTQEPSIIQQIGLRKAPGGPQPGSEGRNKWPY